MRFKLPRLLRETCQHRRRTLSALAGAATVFACRTKAIAADELDGQSSAAVKQQALRELPTNLLNREAQGKIANVVQSASYFRRMPEKTIECDAKVFEQLVRYPEILVGVWDLMGVTKVQVERVAPYIFRGDDSAGTRCVAELLMGNDRTHVYYATGDYSGKLIARNIDGRSVCVIHSKPSVSSDGRPLITAYMDVFIKLDNIGADLIVKTLSPLMASTADQNYVESLRFVSQLSQAAINNPSGVKSLVYRMRQVQQEVKERFIATVYLASEQSLALEDEDSATVDEVAQLKSGNSR